jgi:hypothetical protein
MRKVLVAHDLFPALMTDQVGTLLAANDATEILLEGVDADLLVPPVNVRRVALHLRGLAPRVRNFDEWGRRVIEMIESEVESSLNPDQSRLLDELKSYVGTGRPTVPPTDPPGVAMPLRLSTTTGELRLLTTVTRFSTANDVTVAGIRVEALLPANDETADRLQALRSLRRK